MLPDNLDPVEIRVVGCLIEKEYTTPDNYPLSLNALTNACNQSSNRDPVLSLEEGAVMQALDSLRRRGLVRSIQPIGSRVSKFQHLLGEVADLSRAELAVLSVLTLRGPQTQAEVRSRGARLMPGDDASGLDAALDGLVMREQQPLVTRLARRPGQKEARYAHLLAGEVHEAAEDIPVAPVQPAAVDRLSALEAQMQEMRNELAELRAQIGEFRRTTSQR
jgi:uncharacterized protein YceH (UPF0502 family)